MNNKITYHREGDYFIPDLCLLKQPNGHIGKYGRLRLNYLNIIKQNSQKRQSYHKRIVQKKSIIIHPLHFILPNRQDWPIFRFFRSKQTAFTII